MKQSLSKLVDVILERLAERPEAKPNDSGLRSWLLREGYAQRDIDAALQLVSGRVGKPESRTVDARRVRHLSPFESYRLTPEAQAALARLEMYELIDPYEREMILDRMDQLDGLITVADLEHLVNWVVCSTRDVETQQTLYSVLDGKDGVVH